MTTSASVLPLRSPPFGVDRVSRSVYLVGSVPFEDAEAVFRRCSAILGPALNRLPDGERGGWLPGADFTRMSGLVTGNGASLLNPPVTQTVRLAEGTAANALAFEHLHYYPNAIGSYAVFTRLKHQGVVGPNVKYQVSIPTAFTGSIYFDRDQVRELWPAYEQALLRDVRRVCDAIPHQDLAIAWDVVEFGISLANPEPLERFTPDELAQALAKALDAVPASVECGMHFCYGGHNSNGMPREGLNRRELTDAGLMTGFFNRVRRLARRRIDWLHIPVPRPQGDPAYFAPLEDLDADGCELYLGLLYPDDGVDVTLRKIDHARPFAGDFGVAAACGLNPFVSGLPAERITEVLEYHRRIAELS